MALLLTVWRMRPPNPGHVSLETDGVYMSYWPADAAGKKDVKVGQTHEAAFPSSYRIDRRIEQRECDVRRQLVGSWGGGDELLRERPQRRYLAGILFPLSRGPADGWGSPVVVIPGVLCVFSLVALIWVETHIEDPMLALRFE